MRVVIIGAGPAGMMAALTAAQSGDDVTILEKNDKIGKKLFITGKGRCNITNDCDNRTFISNVVSNQKFLMSAIAKWSTADTISMCRDNGLPVKVERGGRVFPESDKSSDFIKLFDRLLKRAGVSVRLMSTVEDILVRDGAVYGVRVNGQDIACDKVIVATGGVSYPATGSTGDGYRFAERVGHTVMPILPALVGINLKDRGVAELAGLSLKNVAVRAERDGKVLAEDFGEMLFTHTGVSGPIILTLSSLINKIKGSLQLVIDLKPALSAEQLDQRLQRDFEANINRDIRNAISDLTVGALIPVLLWRSGINASKKVHQVTREERLRLVDTVKNLRYDIAGLCGVASGIVTCGGVNVKEINSRNMESKIVSGLHFAGEVLDVDGLTGGFNIQIALSTGYLAGLHS